MTDLGSAELELGADLAPLDRDLVKAERRVAQSVAVMQGMLDSLEAHADVKAAAIEAAASRIASAAGSSTVVREAGANRTVSSDKGEVWGIRGPQHPGSLTNPIVTVLAASKFFPMGSYGAAVGEDNTTDAQRSDSASGLATAGDMAALTAAVHDLAHNMAPASRLANAGTAGIGEPSSAERIAVRLSDPESRALKDMAATLARIESRAATGSGSRTTYVSSNSERTIFTPGSSTGHIPVILSGGDVPAAMGSGGGGGNRRVDIFYHPGSGGGGDGGGGAGFLSRLGWGAGRFGLAGAGSLGSLAGLGFEHVLFTALGLAGSAASAAMGGGLLAAGAAGTMAAGGGSDLLVSRAALSNARAAYTAYENLQTAVATYGKNSRQAQQAQQQLNATLADMPPRVAKASMALATQADSLGTYFQNATAGAQLTADKIFGEILHLAAAYVPLVASAAQRNLGIVNQDLKPLFAWLEGPRGIGIFNDLERIFFRNLPFAMGAFTNGLKVLLRVVDLAAQHTGGLTRYLDRLFTRWNSMSNSQLGAAVDKYINDFRLWEHLIKLLIQDIYYLFKNDAGTGNAIVRDLTKMLEKLKAWETSTRGRQDLHNIFEVHKKEILAILSLLPGLTRGFGAIYMTIAPPLVRAVTGIARAFADVVNALDNLGPGSRALIGLTLISAKLGVLAPALKGLAGLTGLSAALAKIPGLGGVFGAKAGGIEGIRGPVAPGSAANPIHVVGGGPGTGSIPAGERAAEDAGLGLSARATAGIAGASVLGISGFAAMAHAQGGALNKLNALAHGIDPTSVLHLVGLPALSDLLPAVKKAHPVSALDLAAYGMGLDPAALRRLISGPAPSYGRTSLGAVGGPVGGASLTQQTRDFLQMNAALAALEQKQAGVKRTAVALDELAAQAAKLGDTRYTFADRLGAELLKSHGVASRGIRDLLTEFGKLPAGVKKPTALAMSQMVLSLQRGGALTQRQVGTMLSEIVSTAGKKMPEFADTIAAAMLASGTATNKGMKAIVGELNQFLGLVGGSKLSLPQLVGLARLQQSTAQYFASQGPGGVGDAARGALFQIGQPGQAGRDTVPLNVGGMPIMVAPGEQVAVFNRHQLPIVNAALAGYGGLPGLFQSVSTPNYMASGGIVAPAVSGGGALGSLVHASLALAARAARSYVGAHAPRGSAGAGSASGLSGSLLAIVHQIAKRMGWGPALIQDWLNVIGAESGGSMTATNPSSGAYGIAQMYAGLGYDLAANKAKYYQYGGDPNTLAGQLIAMANYMKDAYGGPAGAWASEVTRHAYASGGLVSTRKKPLSPQILALLAKARRRARKPKAPRALGGGGGAIVGFPGAPGVIGTAGPFPFNTSDYGAIGASLAPILSLDGTVAGSGSMGGDAQRLGNLIQFYTNLWSSSLYPPSVPGASDTFGSWDSPPSFVLSTDAQGNTVAPYLSPNLGLVTGELGQIVGWQQQIVQDLQDAYGDSRRLLPRIAEAIKRRVREAQRIALACARTFAAFARCARGSRRSAASARRIRGRAPWPSGARTQSSRSSAADGSPDGRRRSPRSRPRTCGLSAPETAFPRLSAGSLARSWASWALARPGARSAPFLVPGRPRAASMTFRASFRAGLAVWAQPRERAMWRRRTISCSNTCWG